MYWSRVERLLSPYYILVIYTYSLKMHFLLNFFFFLVKSSKQTKRSSKSKKRGPSPSPCLPLKPDTAYLYFSYHKAIVAALTLSPLAWEGDIEEIIGKVLVVGLGGGALPNYIYQFLPQVCRVVT